MAVTTDFICPCCGHNNFSSMNILWPSLVKEWELTKKEEAYINRQQGLSCDYCHNNLRSMTLAKAMMDAYGEYDLTLTEFLQRYKQLRLLEINEAGTLSPFFADMKYHTLASYPDVNITKLSFADDSFDMVIHSDTLEHVDKPVVGLSETLRVLKPGGFTCFTTPIIVGRLSKKRPRNKPSYHGSPGNKEYLVQTEFGSDIWINMLEVGFYDCRMTALEFPSSVALTGFKKPTPISPKKWHNKIKKFLGE